MKYPILGFLQCQSLHLNLSLFDIHHRTPPFFDGPEPVGQGAVIWPSYELIGFRIILILILRFSGQNRRTEQNKLHIYHTRSKGSLTERLGSSGPDSSTARHTIHIVIRQKKPGPVPEGVGCNHPSTLCLPG